MANEQSLEDLLDRWEALNEQGESITPEELCRDCPELLAEFRRRIRELTVIDHFLRGGEEADPEPPADVRAGRYRPVRLLARGGLGEVFVAVDEELSREVALKRLQPCRAWDRAPAAAFYGRRKLPADSNTQASFRFMASGATTGPARITPCVSSAARPSMRPSWYSRRRQAVSGRGERGTGLPETAAQLPLRVPDDRLCP